jgi:hypothetical protein
MICIDNTIESNQDLYFVSALKKWSIPFFISNEKVFDKLRTGDTNKLMIHRVEHDMWIKRVKK